MNIEDVKYGPGIAIRWVFMVGKWHKESVPHGSIWKKWDRRDGWYSTY